MDLPDLSTPRLRLRPMRAWDAPWLQELLTDDDIRYRTLQPKVQWGRAWVVAAAFAMLDVATWVIEENASGTAVGWVALNSLEPAPHPAVGFEIRKRFWNRGYATEAVQCLVRHTFSTAAKPALSGLVFTDNRASQRVFEKSGFQSKGECECAGHPCILYELIRDF